MSLIKKCLGHRNKMWRGNILIKVDVQNPKTEGNNKPVTFATCIIQPVDLIFHGFREHLISISAAV